MGEKKNREKKGREERQRKKRGLKDAVFLHFHGPRKWDVELLLGSQESPWRLNAGLSMINTPRQLSSWSLLKYIRYYLNTMIFRAERSRWGGGRSSSITGITGVGSFPEERDGMLTPTDLSPPPSLDPELPVSSTGTGLYSMNI